MFEKAIKLNPLPDPTLPYLLAAAYQWVGRYEDAIIEGKKALQLNPNNALTHFVLVRAYTKLGRKEEARAILEAVMAKDADSSPYHGAENRIVLKLSRILLKKFDQ